MRSKCWNTVSRMPRVKKSAKQNVYFAKGGLRRPPFLFLRGMAFARTKTYTLEAATAAIQRYCAFQERCQSEVEERLRGMGVLPEAQADIVAGLMSDGYLSEERFARSYARGKFRIKGWGPRKIAQGLQAKRVSGACIALGLSELDPDQVRDYLVHQRAKYPDDHEFLTWAYRRGFDRSSALEALRVD